MSTSTEPSTRSHGVPPRPISSIGSRIERAASEFQRCIWPLISHKLGPGELVPVEGLHPDPLASMVDRALGIDYLFRPAGRAVFGIGQRISTTTKDTPWNTFTMNVSTYDRMAASAGKVGYLVPAVLVHSYVRRTQHGLVVESVGMAVTCDLLDFARRHPREPKWSNQGSGAPFYAWSFEELVSDGIHVDRFPAPDLLDPFKLLPLA